MGGWTLRLKNREMLAASWYPSGQVKTLAISFCKLLALLAITVGLAWAGFARDAGGPARMVRLDHDWKFVNGDPEGAEARGFDNSGWRTLSIPHDWSIEGSFREDNKSGRAGGFAPLGTGWYRKAFVISSAAAGRRILLHFDGVFAEATVWLNGQKVAENSSGYLGFSSDVTAQARLGQTNLLAVRVDNPRQASRWYTGSGIYRHVWLETVHPLHVPRWGTYISTPRVSETSAEARVVTTVRNDSSTAEAFTLTTKVLNPSGRVVCTAETRTNVAGNSTMALEQQAIIKKPKMWSVESPELYRAVSELKQGDESVDATETKFGIRTIEFRSNGGFFLNGRQTVLKGVCIHHDNGAVGAASIDRLLERRLEALKSLGCNAVRLSHNPHAPEILDLCDELGLLVYDEAFDKWAGFSPDGKGWKEDLRRFLIRDRTHPSVILWSVGNEVKEQLKPEGVALYASMAEAVHEVDPTRPVTCALHPARNPNLELPEMALRMDVVSMNYQSQLYEQDHAKYPNMVILGSETLPWYCYNLKRSGDEPKFIPGNAWFALRDYVAGQFIWAGIDYLGESPGWPLKGWPLGLVDTCGFPKDFSYYQKSLQSDSPMVRIAVFDPRGGDAPGKAGWGWPNVASHWNWKTTGDLKVATFSNCSDVELILNGRSLGRKALADFPDRVITWTVPNEAGTLRAIGWARGKKCVSHELRTAGAAARIKLIPDRVRIAANGSDVSCIEVQMVDARGTVVPDADRLVTFETFGPGSLIAVDNGDLASSEAWRAARRTTLSGRCLAIVQSGRQAGRLRLVARAEGLPAAEVLIRLTRPIVPSNR